MVAKGKPHSHASYTFTYTYIHTHTYIHIHTYIYIHTHIKICVPYKNIQSRCLGIITSEYGLYFTYSFTDRPVDVEGQFVQCDVVWCIDIITM